MGFIPLPPQPVTVEPKVEKASEKPTPPAAPVEVTPAPVDPPAADVAVAPEAAVVADESVSAPAKAVAKSPFKKKSS